MNDAHCRNCDGALGEGPYCPHCGQKTAGLPTLRELFSQFLDDVLSLDSKFARTYSLLLFRPGRLTRAYLNGKRASFMRPLRLYLLNSLVFFLVAASSGTQTIRWNEGARGVDTESDSTTVVTDAALASALRGADFDPPVRERLHTMMRTAGEDSTVLAAIDPAAVGQGFLDEYADAPLIGPRMASQARKMERLGAENFGEAFNASVLGNLPKVVFALVPVFAAVLALIYRRSRRRYAEHFVFALHAHAAAFLLLTIAVLSKFAILDAMLLAAVPVHGVVSLRHVYAQPWWKTIVKAALITSAYFVCLAGGLLVAFAVTFMTF